MLEKKMNIRHWRLSMTNQCRGIAYFNSQIVGGIGMEILLGFLVLSGLFGIYDALRKINTNINRQFDQNQKVLELLTEIREELRKR
jgi:hypothetical protein